MRHNIYIYESVYIYAYIYIYTFINLVGYDVVSNLLAKGYTLQLHGPSGAARLTV